MGKCSGSTEIVLKEASKMTKEMGSSSYFWPMTWYFGGNSIGTMLCRNGARYEGEWADDIRNGYFSYFDVNSWFFGMECIVLGKC